MDTAIKAEQRSFFKETGGKAADQVVPGTSVEADAMMSPMAGESSLAVMRVAMC